MKIKMKKITGYFTLIFKSYAKEKMKIPILTHYFCQKTHFLLSIENKVVPVTPAWKV